MLSTSWFRSTIENFHACYMIKCYLMDLLRGMWTEVISLS